VSRQRPGGLGWFAQFGPEVGTPALGQWWRLLLALVSLALVSLRLVTLALVSLRLVSLALSGAGDRLR
jgi:hypothetical protein